MIIETNSPEETYDFGYKLGISAKKGDIYCLSGDLGVGKTVFTKGFAKGLGIKEHITSPTFTIVNEYEGEKKFNHFDVYRIEDLYELDEIGFDEYLYSDAITLIEWPEIVKEVLPDNSKWIRIEKDIEKGFEYRKINYEDKE